MKGSLTRSLVVIHAIIIFIFLGGASLADELPDSTKKPFNPKFYIYLGAFSPNISTTVTLDGKHTPGTVFSLENDLGLADRPWVFRFDGIAQFTKRSGLSLAFINIDRNQEWVIDRDIKIRDTTFHVGAKLGFYFNTQFYSASYRYNIFSKPTWKAGLSIGVRWLQVKIGVNLENDSSSGYIEAVSVPAPAPVLGLYGSAFLIKNLQVRYNFDYFSLSVKGVRAGVLDNRFALEYYIIRNLGIGASMNLLYYHVKELPIGKNFDGEFKYSLSGFSLFAAVRF